MKKWEKPEVRDLSLKFTNFNTTWKEDKPEKDTWGVCGHKIQDPNNFLSTNNHKGWCSHVGGPGVPPQS